MVRAYSGNCGLGGISRGRGRFARSDLASICKINVAISKFSRSRKAFMKRYRSEVTGTWPGAFYADLASCKTVSFTSYMISESEQLETKLEIIENSNLAIRQEKICKSINILKNWVC